MEMVKLTSFFGGGGVERVDGRQKFKSKICVIFVYQWAHTYKCPPPTPSPLKKNVSIFPFYVPLTLTAHTSCLNFTYINAF